MHMPLWKKSAWPALICTNRMKLFWFIRPWMVSAQFWLNYQSFWFKVQNLLFIRHESDLWLNLSVTQAPTVVETWRKRLLQRKLHFKTWFCFKCWCCCWGMRWRELSDSWHLGNSLNTSFLQFGRRLELSDRDHSLMLACFFFFFLSWQFIGSKKSNYLKRHIISMTRFKILVIWFVGLKESRKIAICIFIVLPHCKELYV